MLCILLIRLDTQTVRRALSMTFIVRAMSLSSDCLVFGFAAADGFASGALLGLRCKGCPRFLGQN